VGKLDAQHREKGTVIGNFRPALISDHLASVHSVSPESKRGGKPNGKEELETIRLCVSAAPGLRPVWTSASISTSKSGFG
jgi:hypothetical protein